MAAACTIARNLHVVGEPTPTWGVRIRVHGRRNVETGRALSQMPINMWKRVGIHSKRDWDWVLTLDFDPKP